MSRRHLATRTTRVSDMRGRFPDVVRAVNQGGSVTSFRHLPGSCAHRQTSAPLPTLSGGVTPVPDGSVGTDGKTIRRLDSKTLIATACVETTRQRNLAQLQIFQALELAQLGRDRAVNTELFQGRHPSIRLNLQATAAVVVLDPIGVVPRPLLSRAGRAANEFSQGCEVLGASYAMGTRRVRGRYGQADFLRSYWGQFPSVGISLSRFGPSQVG